jgi:L-ascorbate peroxidase
MHALRASTPAAAARAVRAPLVLRPSSSRQNRLIAAAAASSSASPPPVDVAALKADLASAKKDVAALIQSKHCNPILLRMGFHDAGTYDRNTGQGGAVGCSHFPANIGAIQNAGLPVAVSLLTEIKKKHPLVSWADLFQMSSAVAVELAGGPVVPLRFGRVDAPKPEDANPGNLPDAAPPAGHANFHDGSATPAEHLRRVFTGRMGLTDRDIVALSGAHSLGRVRPERSGFGKESTKYTEKGPGTPGGSSWTVDWLVFNNDYYIEALKAKEGKGDADLVVLPTDQAVFDDAEFAKFGKLYAEDQAAFFRDYVEAHMKMSELGVTWLPGTPVTL